MIAQGAAGRRPLVRFSTRQATFYHTPSASIVSFGLVIAHHIAGAIGSLGGHQYPNGRLSPYADVEL
jgi:hypothetical protein